MENINRQPVVYRSKKVPDTNLEKLQKVIERKHNVKFESYWELHKWSIENYTKFIEELWQFFEIISSKPYEKVWVKTGPDFIDNAWFTGARLNYAENMLRLRDDTIALICFDELGNKETITYAEVYEEVKCYSAAFRKNGLKTGDTVACFMSNRKEAIFAMLAVVSIGAVWGGPGPFYGAQAASNIVSMMDAKFLVAVDSHQDNGIIYPTLDSLPRIANNTPTLERIILVVTQEETRRKNLSSIRNCSFLEDFLQEGRDPDGNIPELTFEQLPFDHPVCILFTSGTSGLPKAAVHSAGCMIATMQNRSISNNLKKGDVIFTNYPVGWSMWESFIPCLGFGATFFLYCGSTYCTVNGKNLWDIVAEFKCTVVELVTCMADKMEKLDIIPSVEKATENVSQNGVKITPNELFSFTSVNK